MARTLLTILGAGLWGLGWLTLSLGGIFALLVGVFEVVGYGDHGPHFSWEDVYYPGAVLAAGGVLVWLGRAVRRAAPRPPPSAPPPG